jgi:hypothetical protein
VGPLLESFLKTGTFPEKIVEDLTGKIALSNPVEKKIHQSLSKKQTRLLLRRANETDD